MAYKEKHVLNLIIVSIYFLGEGRLTFKTGEMSKDIQIAIIDDMSANGKEEFFEVELFDISEGAKFGGVTRTKAIKND